MANSRIVSLEMPPIVDSLSDSISSIQIVHDLSPFERLPRELTWMIFDYTHESLGKIRETSRPLRFRVHEYAFRNTQSPIVDRIKFEKSNRATTMDITIDVKKRHAPLFELRLCLCLPVEWITRVQRLAVPGVDGSWEYSIPIMSGDDETVLARLGNCLGRRVKCVNVAFCDAQPALNAVAKILEGVDFEKLIYRTDELSDAAAAFLTLTVSANEVEHVALKISRVACAQPENLLLQMSMNVRSLRIFQHCSTGMFSIPDDRWVDLIVELFSAKLDKLYIRNPAYAGFLGVNCADALAGRFSELRKPIWFEASCNAHENGLDFIVKEYSVKGEI